MEPAASLVGRREDPATVSTQTPELRCCMIRLVRSCEDSADLFVGITVRPKKSILLQDAVCELDETGMCC